MRWSLHALPTRQLCPHEGPVPKHLHGINGMEIDLNGFPEGMVEVGCAWRRELAGNFWGCGVLRMFHRKDYLPDTHKGKPVKRPDGDGKIGAAELACAANPYNTLGNKIPRSLQMHPCPSFRKSFPVSSRGIPVQKNHPVQVRPHSQSNIPVQKLLQVQGKAAFRHD
eukprot:gene6844-biopygen1478